MVFLAITLNKPMLKRHRNWTDIRTHISKQVQINCNLLHAKMRRVRKGPHIGLSEYYVEVNIRTHISRSARITILIEAHVFST